MHGRDGAVVHIRAHKPRVVLSTLLLHSGTWVSTDLIGEAVWEGRAPRSAAGNIKTYMSQLRRTLVAAGDSRDRIDSRPGAYRVLVKRHELDVLQFEQAIRLGMDARRTGADAEALGQLRLALELWRGSPFEDLPMEIRVADAVRLEERRWTAIEELIDLRVGLGEYDVVLPELRALTAAYPMRERLWRHLLLALSRSGRRAEALSAYRNLYQLMTDQLGVEPGAELRNLHQQVLTGAL